MRIGLTHMGSTPLRATAAEEALRGQPLTRTRSPRPPSRPPRAPTRRRDLNASPDYKRHLARVLTRRALDDGGSMTRSALSTSPDVVGEALAGEGYLADRALATAAYLAAALEQPLLLEGEAGVGKTEVARALAAATGARADPPAVPRGHRPPPRGLRLGLPAPAAGDPRGRGRRRRGRAVSRRFLLRRPLLEALEHDGPAVLLIDEIDRADDEFEAFLLEFLSDFAITIPELGTITAARAPAGRADLQPHARAARRAQAPLPVPLDRLPDARARGRDRPHAAARRAEEAVAARVCDAVARLRERELYKLPGVGETITWARALLALDGRRRRSTTRSASR